MLYNILVEVKSGNKLPLIALLNYKGVPTWHPLLEKGYDMKEEVFKFRLTSEEKAVIQEKAKAANLTMSQYAKKLLLSGKVEQKNFAAEKDRLKIKMEMRRIGNNINQAVRIMNMYHDTEEWNVVYKSYLELKAFLESKLNEDK